MTCTDLCNSLSSCLLEPDIYVDTSIWKSKIIYCCLYFSSCTEMRFFLDKETAHKDVSVLEKGTVFANNAPDVPLKSFNSNRYTAVLCIVHISL